MKKILSLLLAVLILAAPHSLIKSRAASASAFCLMDADTGDVLFSSRERERLPMASTTKVMTCLVALRLAETDRIITVPAEAVGVEGSSAYLTEGEKLSLSDLLFALMLQSANDAAVTIAVGISGSVDAFVSEMNRIADEIGLTDTHYSDPHGLSSEDHYSTASDLCRLMACAMRDEVFAVITGSSSARIPAPDGSYRYLSNHNKLLRTYNDCVGGKTGYTKAAGRCLVSAARRNGKLLVCATLNAPDDWNDHKSLYEKGFSQYHLTRLCDFGSIRVDLPVVGGETDHVTVANLSGEEVLLLGDHDPVMILEAPRFLYAPVPGIEFAEDQSFYLRRVGISVGDAVFYQDGREVARVPLYPMENVGAAPKKKSIWERIVDWFRLRRTN